MNLYETLGLAKGSSVEEVKKAYRSLAKQHHPDKNPGDEECAKKFKEITEAYDVLSDPKKKENYDRYGSTKPYTSVVDDFFTPRKRNIGENISVNVNVTFKQVMEGGEVEISYQNGDVCSSCDGNGGTLEKCSTCNGQGVLVMKAAGNFMVQMTCSACDGKGSRISNKCEKCTGGLVLEDRKLVFQIPKGVESGMSFVRQGMGFPFCGGEGINGNLHVNIQVEPHFLLKRGDHGSLYLDVPVTYSQLVLGCELEVFTMKGMVKLKVPKGTTLDRVFRMKDMGLPLFNKNGNTYKYGYQFVNLVLDVPRDVSEEHARLLEQLGEMEKDTPLRKEMAALLEQNNG